MYRFFFRTAGLASSVLVLGCATAQLNTSGPIKAGANQVNEPGVRYYLAKSQLRVEAERKTTETI